MVGFEQARCRRVVQLMNRNAQSSVRVRETFSDDFLIQVGLHQGLVLNPLLEESREIKLECQE